MGKSRKIISVGNKGYCRICCKECDLTWDHIPPKSISGSQNVKIYDILGTESNYSQDGNKKKSICSNCNNHLLGLKYDPEMLELSKQVKNYYEVYKNSKLILPDVKEFSYKPQRLARCVIGHTLADSFEMDPSIPPTSSPMNDSLRDYFLQENSSLSPNFRIFYWLYPYDNTLVLQNTGIAKPAYNDIICCAHILKFNPLAFLITYQLKYMEIRLPYMPLNTITDIDSEYRFCLNMKDRPDQSWPEKPSNDMIILFDKSYSSYVVPTK